MFVVTQIPNMSLSAKREALTRIHGRYQRAGRPHKSRILDEFCATCGYHRKAALRLLNRPLSKDPPKRSGPKIIYDPATMLPVLKAIWLASDQLCSKLLKAALPEWLEHHERRGALLPEEGKAFRDQSGADRPAAAFDAREASEERAFDDASGNAVASRRADALGAAGHLAARLGGSGHGGALR
jgi:hypothetical protein